MPRTTSNKPTPKKSSVKAEPKAAVTKSEPAVRTQMTPTQRRNLYIIFGLGLVIALLYFLKGTFVVATVNNMPITRYHVIKSLEQQGGKAALEALISEQLLREEAKKQGVTVSSQEVQDRMKAIEEEVKASGQSLDDILKAQNVTRKEVEDQTMLQLMLKKLLADKITVTDAEVNEAFEQQKAAMPKGTNEADFKEQLRESLENQKMSFEAQTFIQGLQTKAKINYWHAY